MKKQNFLLVPALLLTLAPFTLVSCAGHSTAQDIKQEAKQEPVIEGPDQLKTQLKAIVEADQTLTPSERYELNTIIDETYTKTHEIDVMSNQKKSLLMKELLKEKPDLKRMNGIKKELYKAQKQRTDLMMSGIDRAAKTLRVHANTSGEPVMNSFMRQMMR